MFVLFITRVKFVWISTKRRIRLCNLVTTVFRFKYLHRKSRITQLQKIVMYNRRHLCFKLVGVHNIPIRYKHTDTCVCFTSYLPRTTKSKVSNINCIYCVSLDNNTQVTTRIYVYNNIYRRYNVPYKYNIGYRRGDRCNREYLSTSKFELFPVIICPVANKRASNCNTRAEFH